MRSVLIAAVILFVARDVGSKPQLGSVKGTVNVLKSGKAKADKTGVVIYLEGVSGSPPTPADHAVIRQREKQFDPPMTVVVRGTTIDFPNEDKIFHNVFSVSRPARFDLGLYKSGTMKSVEMKRTGTVDVYCNIHPDMVAKVKVLDNGYYTITGKDGSFKIANVPAGEYPIVAWLPTGDEVKGRVTVKAGQAADVRKSVV